MTVDSNIILAYNHLYGVREMLIHQTIPWKTTKRQTSFTCAFHKKRVYMRMRYNWEIPTKITRLNFQNVKNGIQV